MKVPKARRLSSGRWFIQLRLNGESIPVTADTERECTKQAMFIKAEYAAGLREQKKDRPFQSCTLYEILDEYISDHTHTLSPETIRGYRVIQRNRFQAYMQQPLKKLPPWQRIVNAEATLCSPKTLRNAWGLVRSAIAYKTGEAPADISLPAVPPANKAFFTPDQIRVFVQAIKDTPHAIPLLLGLCSLRSSEIFGLDWSDIPLNPQFLRISGSVVRDEHNQRVKKPQNKTRSSTRNVPIMIPELKVALERERKPSGPVVTCSWQTLRRAISHVCEENCLPDVGLHGLRHSFASLAYHLQIPEKIAMEIGGWSDPATMHNIYVHISSFDITRYQNKMTDFYSN